MIGEVLAGRYRILRQLGRGGMGSVYVAHDPLLERDVAIKVVPPERLNAETEARFQGEARIVARMDHPGIVAIFDLGRHHDALFFVMPVVEGITLRDRLRQKPLLQPVAFDIAAQVAEALDYSHAQGVVHRDIKPENIMVAADAGGRLRARVMDFGIAVASAAVSAGGRRLTVDGMIVGTLSYLAPEQVSGAAVDGRTDIYALGVVLYEMLAGRPPFQGDLSTLLYKIAHEPPQPPSALGVTVDAALEATIMDCLAKAPAARPATGGELVLRLRPGIAAGSAHETGSQTIAPHSTLPGPALFGRARELGLLLDRFELAKAGECHLVVIGGEAGAGKTRLLAEVERHVRRDHAQVLHGRFIERRDACFPYQAFCDVIQESQRLRGATFARPDLSDLMLDLATLFPVLHEAEERTSAARTPGPAPRLGKQAVFELLSRTIGRIGAGRPLVLLFEDLHEADVSLGALQYAFRRLGATPTLILGTYRTGAVEPTHALARMNRAFRDDARFLSLMLDPLSAEEHRRLVESLFGSTSIDPGLAAHIFRITEGNPFFTAEMLRSLFDSGKLQRGADGQWLTPGGCLPEADALPATVQEVVERRLENATDADRALLAFAAVLGPSFEQRDLEALAGAAATDAAVDGLVIRGYLEEDRHSRGQRLAFVSGLMREVIYAEIPLRRRRALHRAFATQLEARRPRRGLPVLAHHFGRAGVPEKAAAYAVAAAQAALQAANPEDAARFARAALEAVGEDADWDGAGQQESAAYLVLARVQAMHGDVEAALASAQRAIAILRGHSAILDLLEALRVMAEAAWSDRRVEEAKAAVEEGLGLPRHAGDEPARRRLLQIGEAVADQRGGALKANDYRAEAGRLGAVATGTGAGVEVQPAPVSQLLAHGEYLALQDAYRQATSQAAGLPPARQAELLFELASLCRRLGRYEEGLEHCLHGVPMAATCEPLLAAHLEAMAASLCCSLGRFDEAQSFLNCVERLGPEAPSTSQTKPLQWLVFTVRGHLLLAAGCPIQAIESYARGLDLWDAADAQRRATTLFDLGNAHIHAGNHTQARRLLEQALDGKRAAFDQWGVAWARHGRASILHAEGEADGALAEALAGIEVASEVGDPRVMTLLRLDAGRARLVLCDVEGAEEEFLRATRDAERTRALPELVEAQLGLAAVNRERGRFVAAEVAARIGVEISRQMGARTAAASAHLALGEVYCAAAQFEPAREQLEAALALAVELGNPHRRFEVRLSLFRLALAEGHGDEAVERAEALRHEGVAQEHLRLRGRAWLALSEARLAQGRQAQAQEAAIEALKDLLMSGAHREAVAVHDLLARLAQQAGNGERALRHAHAGVELAKALGPDAFRERGRASFRLGHVHFGRHETVEIKKALGAGIRFLKEGASGSALADGYCDVAALLARDEPERAVALLQESVRLATGADYPACAARAHGHVADLSWRLGRLNEAVEALRAEADTLENSGFAAGQPMNRLRLAWCYGALGDFKQAAAILKPDCPPGTRGVYRARCLGLRGLVLTELGQFSRARADLDQALAIAEPLGDPREMALVCRARAEHFIAYGALPHAKAELDRGRQLTAELPDSTETHYGALVAQALELSHARLLLLRGDAVAARDLATATQEAIRRYNSPIEEVEAALVRCAAMAAAEDPIAAEELQILAECAHALGLEARRTDAIFILSRLTRDLALAEEGYRQSVALQSPPRMASFALLVAALEEKSWEPMAPGRVKGIAVRLIGEMQTRLPPESHRAAREHWTRAAQPA